MHGSSASTYPSSSKKEDWLLKKEVEFLEATCGSLGDLPMVASSYSTQQISQEGTRIRVPTDCNSNVKLFGYCLLSLCFQRCKDSDYAQQVLTNFKSMLYADDLKLDTFSPDEIDPQLRPFYSNALLKKVMVEFLQIMQFYTKSTVLEMLQRYPVIETIMVLAFRSCLGSRTIKYTTTKSPLLSEYFSKILKVRILYNSTIKEYAFLGTKLIVDEESDPEYSFVCEEQVTKAVRSKNSSLVPVEFQDQLQPTYSLQIIGDPKNHNHPVHSKGPVKLARQSLQERDSSLHKSSLYAEHRANGSLEPTADLTNILVIPKKQLPEKRISGETPTQGVCFQDDILVIPKRLNLTQQAEDDYEYLNSEPDQYDQSESSNTGKGRTKKLADLYSPQNYHFSGNVPSFGEQYEKTQREERDRILSKSTFMEEYQRTMTLNPLRTNDALLRKQSFEPTQSKMIGTSVLEMVLGRQQRGSSPSKMKSFQVYPNSNLNSGSFNNLSLNGQMKKHQSSGSGGTGAAGIGSPKHDFNLGQGQQQEFPSPNKVFNNNLIKPRPRD